MISYKDMTFCRFYDQCQNPCFRSLTPEVRKSAQAFGLPIAEFANKPYCFVDITTDE